MQEYTILLFLFGAAVFYQLRKAETNTLLALIIIIAGVASYYAFLYTTPSNSAPAAIPDSDTADRREAVSQSFAVSKFTKPRFLLNNSGLTAIVKDLRFIRIFDTARFGDLLIHMEKLQKVYMYILSGRYYPPSYIGTFTDLRQLILEILYGLVHIVPPTLKHTYGLDPYAVINKNIDAFTALSRKMLGIIRAYSRDRGYQIPDTHFHPHEPSRKNILP